MSTAFAAPDVAARTRDCIKVMVVDDSVVVRGLLSRWLEGEPDIEVVAVACTGREAVDLVERADPDVVILDVEMPELDGLSALPLLLAKKRDLVVIMASSLTRRQAEVSLRALSLGAIDYAPKPQTSRGIGASPEFRCELVEKIRELGLRRLRRRDPAAAMPLSLRHQPAKSPRALVVGASTGGPQALTALIACIGPVIDRAPVLIVQHMPPTFTMILAEQLARSGGRPVREAIDGEPIVPGTVYLAPGGRHMQVVRRDGRPAVRLDDGPPVNFCKPAVDLLFSSAAAIWDGAVLAAILTGMGQDGRQGARAIVAAGGSVIAQDEATSVVWGMPGAVARAGLCSAVLPLERISSKIVRAFSGEGS